jgi:hypothetical protein
MTALNCDVVMAMEINVGAYGLKAVIHRYPRNEGVACLVGHQTAPSHEPFALGAPGKKVCQHSIYEVLTNTSITRRRPRQKDRLLSWWVRGSGRVGALNFTIDASNAGYGGFRGYGY